MASHDMLQEPVAIIGIACEYPGDIHSPTDFWRTLEKSRDVGSAIPRDRTDISSYFAHMFNMDNDGQFQKQLFRNSYFLSASQWDMFEPSFFGLRNETAASIDPCHRLLMLKFVHLLDDAGYTLEKMQGSRTSVHIAQESIDHTVITFRMRPEHLSRFQGSNTLHYNAPSRLSYHFNLQGPNRSIDIASASSLQTVQLALQTLRAGEADMAVCGAVNSMYTPESYLHGSTMGAISPDGRSRSFDANANGYAKAEGLGLLLLKRLSDAERDGDRIYCVLRDILSNNDGNEDKRSFLAPSASGQIRLLSSIYERNNIDSERVFYVEAHGTGTPVGDPIETNAIGRFFYRSQSHRPLLIGSVKSNLGHTEAGSGITSLIKIALCMRYRTIPPNMHLKTLNPKIQAERYNIRIVQRPESFPPLSDKDPVIIGINSFGVGGNNAHAIVEEYRPQHDATSNKIGNGHADEEQIKSNQHFLFIFSTKTRKSLHNQVNQFNVWLQNKSVLNHNNDCAFLARISRQLLLKRTISYPHLGVFVSADRAQLQQQIDAFLVNQIAPGLDITLRPKVISPLKLCFVFSGRGLEWWAMGRQLYKSEPIFNQWIRKIDVEFTKLNNGEWHLLHEMIETHNESVSHINNTNIGQCALFAVQVALAALLVSWHIYPSTIVSYGAGDHAAAFVSGCVTLQEAVRIVYCRSRLDYSNTHRNEQLLVVSMNEDEVQNKLLKGIENLVHIVAVNSPRSVTLSGNEKKIDELEQLLYTLYPDVSKSRLRNVNIFQSYQIDLAESEDKMLSSLSSISGIRLKDSLQIFDVKCAEARLYSSVLGGPVDDQTPLNASYWWRSMRQCVRFGDAIASIIQDEAANAFLELSAHPILDTSIRECYESKNLQCFVFPTLKREEDEQTTLLNSIAQLITSPDVWQHYFKSRDILPTKEDNELFEMFPLYAFDLTPCWYESKELVIERLATRLPIHPLLGVRQWTGHTCATWKSLININLEQHAFLKDHQIQDTIVFPAVCFLELAIAACRQLLRSTDEKEQKIVFEQIQFVQILPLSEHKLTEIFTQVRMPTDEWFIYSRPWTLPDEECMRSSGLSGTDVINSFIDPETLNDYSLRQFTLHAHGRILMNNIEKEKLSSATISSFAHHTWSTNDSTDVYTYLSTRGYQYGPCFQLMKSLRGSTSTVVAEIRNNMKDADDAASYSMFHPTVMDACFHPLLSLLPGFETTFLPLSIQRFTSFRKILTSKSLLQICGNYHGNICGIGQEQTYHCDLVVASSEAMINEPFFIFGDFTLQHTPCSQLGRWISEKSVLEKLNASMSVPNADRTVYFDRIITDYCVKKSWTETLPVTSVASLLPSPEKIFHNGTASVNDQDLIESVELLNDIAACYAQLAIENLDRNCVQQNRHHLLTACSSLASRLQQQVTFYSTQIRLMNLFKQFPRLRPLLTVLAAYGSHLRQVLIGKQNELEVFLGSDEIKRAWQQMQTLIWTNKIVFVFQAIDQYLRQQHVQNDRNSLFGRILRVIWLNGGNNFDTLPIFQLWLDLSRDTGLFIELRYIDMNPVRLTQAQQILDMHERDQKRFKITYDNTFDLLSNTINKTFGFESYDIIFTANTLQGSENLTSSLIALRHLLVPNGLLFLLELTKAPLYFDLIFGLDETWWSSSNNSRALLDVERFATALRRVDGLATVRFLSDQYATSLIVTQKSTSNEILQTLDERQQQAWLLFADNDTQSIGCTLVSCLSCKNITFVCHSTTSFEDIHSKLKSMITKYNQLNVIFAWSLEQISLKDTSEAPFIQHEELMCSTLVHIIETIKQVQPCSYPFIYVLTRHGQLIDNGNSNLLGASYIGFVRNLMVEYERHRLKLIDLQSSTTNINEPLLIHALVQYLETSRYSDHLDEIVLYLDKENNRIKQAEWHYEMLQKEQMIQNESKQVCIIPQRDADQLPFRLQVPSSRFLADLTWIPEQLTHEILSGMMQIRIHCIGLNSRDTLKVLGVYPHVRTFAQSNEDQPHADRDDTEPGSDFVGTVVRSFSDVSIQPGTRVVGIQTGGTLHSHVFVNSCQVVRIPDGLEYFTDEQIATMPTNCLTVFYALRHRVHLKRDQTVLVHAATEGVGQICIQYCHIVGARILATADSDSKCHFLREHYGVEHVFNSQDVSLINNVRAVVPNGVNVVVNSLTDSILSESIKLLSSHGHFVELNKRNVYNKTHLSLFDLRADCSFHVIDVHSLCNERLSICGDMLQEMMQLVVDGKLKPIEPTVTYEPSDVVEAFKRCIDSQTIGNIVIRLTNSAQPLTLNDGKLRDSNQGNADMFSSEVCNQGTILISDGFSSLALKMSHWMIEKRAVKHLILLSQQTLNELQHSNNLKYQEWLQLKQVSNERNTRINVGNWDITEFKQVQNLIAELDETPYPLRGVILNVIDTKKHTFSDLTKDKLACDSESKIRSVWYFHHASQFARNPLRFFILLSSVQNHLLDSANIIDNAANQFFDALALYRARQLHLPALSISLPVVYNANDFDRNQGTSISSKKIHAFEQISSVAIFELIERFYLNQMNCPCPIIFAVNWEKMKQTICNVSSYQLRKFVEQQQHIATKCPTDSSNTINTPISIGNQLETIVERIQVAVARILGLTSVDSISVNSSLNDNGMNSLTTLALYNWLGREMNLFIPFVNVLSDASIQSIAQYVYNKLKEKTI